MAIYSIEIKIYATAYIRADSAEAALKTAQWLANQGIELQSQSASENLEISGLQLDDPALPDVSLSPAMTIHGPDDGDVPDLAHDEDEDETESAEA